jgi:hypothetical protein
LFLLCSLRRGDILRYAIAFTFRRARKIVRGFKQELTEAERFAVADHSCGNSKRAVILGT